MNTLKRNIVMATAALSVSLATASAQTFTLELTTTVPFSFQVGSHVLPAGDYRIPVGQGQPVRIVNREDSHASYTGIPLDMQTKPGDDPRLVFLCRDGRCALREIHTTEGYGYEFLAPKWSKSDGSELAKVVILSAKLSKGN